jgi:hypothetical protein
MEKEREAKAKQERRVEVRPWIFECGTPRRSWRIKGIVGTIIP